MYKISFVVLVAAVMCGAVPLNVELPEQIEDQPTINTRVTCDILSGSIGGVTVGHAACAAHCIYLGYAGGRCINAVCNCR
ncbi:Defensin [Carabus blaptoides fortunei]